MILLLFQLSYAADILVYHDSGSCQWLVTRRSLRIWNACYIDCVDINMAPTIMVRSPVMIWLIIVMQVLDVCVYRFDEGYVEFWYQLPIAAFVDSPDIDARIDSVTAAYSYFFRIWEDEGVDSAIVEGSKSLGIYQDDWQDLIIDYLPLYLYSGRFKYDFRVQMNQTSFSDTGTIEIPQETVSLACSDLVLGRKGFARILFRGVDILPALNTDFSPDDHLCSFLELYGLVPDSLYYRVDYRINDHTGSVLHHETRELLKHDYTQVDTHAIDLSAFVTGTYEYSIEVLDPTAGSRVGRTELFSVIASRAGAAEGEFYRAIRYLVNSNEYKKFRGLSDTQQDIYLKDFWKHHDYRQFERRIREADNRFSAGKLSGRDSDRGRLYIMLGPPDEIEVRSIENWARPFEIWYYYGRNDFLFSDIRNDNNPRLIKVLKPGELTNILTTGMREGSRAEEWLSDIAPGTYDWYEDKTSPE